MSKAPVVPPPKPSVSPAKKPEEHEHFAFGITRSPEGLWAAYKYTLKGEKILKSEEVYMPSHDRSVPQDQLEVAVSCFWPGWK